MTEETKLLPCPFCGGKAERIEIEEGDEVVVNIGGSIIECTQCHVSSPVHFERKENLVSSWNTRALSPPEPTEGLRIQGIMERHAPDGFDPASDDMTIPFAIKIGELEEQLTALRTLPLQQRTVNETTPSHNLLMQAENMLAAWERMYRLINPRDNFPKVFADLTEDMEFRELQWLRRAVTEAKPAMVAEQETKS